MDLYDQLLYTPLQTSLTPVVCKIPRTLVVGNKTYTIFTANIVSYTRTILVIPIAVCLKYVRLANTPSLIFIAMYNLEWCLNCCYVRYQYHTTAFLLVALHDFLDHVDGIVAKAHRQMFGQVDDPLLGGFMDAFCDKVLNFSVIILNSLTGKFLFRLTSVFFFPVVRSWTFLRYGLYWWWQILVLSLILKSWYTLDPVASSLPMSSFLVWCEYRTILEHITTGFCWFFFNELLPFTTWKTTWLIW